MKTICGVILAASMTTACASIFSGSNQTIDINSTPDGAAVTIVNKTGEVVFNGTTPTEAQLARSSGAFSSEQYTVTIEKPGVGTETVVVKSTVNGWFIGNIILGGVVGMVVDGATGAMFSYTPSDVDVTLGGGTASLSVTTMDMLSDEERETLVPIS